MTATPAPKLATLINDAGTKQVVESGSQRAQELFGQGYKLMGAPPTVSAPVGNSEISLTPPSKVASSLVADTSMADKLAQAKQQNYDLFKKQLKDAETVASNDSYSTTIKSLADQVRSNLVQTFTPEQQKQNITDLLAKQDEIRQFNLDTTQAKSNVDFNNNILTSQGNMSKAQIDREAAFKSTALSNEESNLLSKVELSRQERADLISGTKTLLDYQDKIQAHIDDAKQEVIAAAEKLDEQQKTKLAMALEAYNGIDPDSLTADQTSSLSRVIMDAGLDPGIVFAGMRAMNAQKTLDNSIKTTQIMGNEDTGYFSYNKVTGAKEQITPPSNGYQLSSEASAQKYASGNDEFDSLVDAIAKLESNFDYQAKSPPNRDGSIAIGKYQILDKNIPSWTQQVLGQSMTPEQFLNNPDAQEIVARKKLAELWQKYGNADDVASVWFSGQPASGNTRSDITGTSVPEYIRLVRQYMSSGVKPQSGSSDTATAQNTQSIHVPDGFLSDIESAVKDLASGKADWGSAFNRIKIAYPNVPDSVIDESLGVKWREPGAWEAYRAALSNKSSSSSTASSSGSSFNEEAPY